MTKPSTIEEMIATAERGQKFCWALVDERHYLSLNNDAKLIGQGRAKELDGLIQQAKACWDAHERLTDSGLFASWVQTETEISRRQAYRLVRCWDRVGWYHEHAVNAGYRSPLGRFDSGTILYVISDPNLIPDAMLDRLMEETVKALEAGKRLPQVTRRSVVDAAAEFRRTRCPSDRQNLIGVKQPNISLDEPEHQHLRSHYRNVTKDIKKVEDGTLPPVEPAPDMQDAQGNPVPYHLQDIFAAREHFARLRQSLLDTAKELHALTHTEAGKGLHRKNTQRLLSVAEDLNLSCPAIIEGNKWLSSKAIIRRTYHRQYSKGKV